MNTIIALDSGLTPVKNFLTQQGCQIININEARNQRVDAVVLSGMDKNIMGMEGIVIDAPVFSAEGMTPEEIWRDIQAARQKH
ncbi:MAG: YkuS family protein [Methylocystaceae bacterium]